MISPFSRALRTSTSPFVIIFDSHRTVSHVRAAEQIGACGQQTPNLRAYLPKVDVLAGKTSNPIPLSDQFPIAGAILGELKVVLVVGVTVQFHNQTAVNQ